MLAIGETQIQQKFDLPLPPGCVRPILYGTKLVYIDGNKLIRREILNKWKNEIECELSNTSGVTLL